MSIVDVIILKEERRMRFDEITKYDEITTFHFFLEMRRAREW